MKKGDFFKKNKYNSVNRKKRKNTDNGKRSGRRVITKRGNISLKTYRRFSALGYFEIKRKH
jgi:hypothetical protein